MAGNCAIQDRIFKKLCEEENYHHPERKIDEI